MRMELSRVSIVTPIFNGIEFLEQAALSVMLQITSFGSLHVTWDWWIGVNGHGRSGGAVAAAVEALRGKLGPLGEQVHLRIFERANKVDTLNALVAEAQGTWIAVLDVDDTWERSKLIVQVTAAQTQAAGAAVIGTFARYFGDVVSDGPALPSGWIAPEILPMLNPLINSSVLLRRDLAKWTNQFPGLDDYDLWFRLAAAGHRFYTIPLTLVNHRIHAGSAFNASGVQDLERIRAHHYFKGES